MILKNKKNSNIIILSIIVIFLSLIGSYNIFLGRYAGKDTTSGGNNVLLGTEAACSISSGGCLFNYM